MGEKPKNVNLHLILCKLTFSSLISVENAAGIGELRVRYCSEG